MGMPIVSQVYVKKGSKREDYEDFVIVNEVDNGKVPFLTHLMTGLSFLLNLLIIST